MKKLLEFIIENLFEIAGIYLTFLLLVFIFARQLSC